jgi:hypothetical protein
MFFNFFIIMYNKVLQVLDLNIEVIYPLDYISKAIPADHPSRETVLALSRKLLIEGDVWADLVKNSLFFHPREIAFILFEYALFVRQS